MKFPDLPLHDSIVQSIEYLWEKKSVRVIGLQNSNDRVEFEIIFSEVSALNLSHMEPWGPSVSIHQATVPEKGSYTLEMQSGDSIQVLANSFTYKEVHT
ncbi:hypothetical protein FG071_19935 [Vibrio cholerae]|nr:hypothetical protein [Vibrio cholerae]